MTTPQPAQPNPGHELDPTVPEAVRLVSGLLADGVLSVELLRQPSSCPAPPAGASGGLQALAASIRVVRELVEAGLLDPAGLCLPGSTPAARTPGPEDKIYAGQGDRFADEILPSELETALGYVGCALLTASRRAAVRESVERVTRTSDGSGAKYNAVGAWRRMFKVAVKDRHLGKTFDPSQEVAKPKRSEGTRQALEQQQLDDAIRLIETTGDDPELDRLIVDTILIAGARREGILNLTLGGLNRVEMTVRLDEKFGKVVHQPVPDWLVADLHAFAVGRGAVRPGDQLSASARAASAPAARSPAGASTTSSSACRPPSPGPTSSRCRLTRSATTASASSSGPRPRQSRCASPGTSPRTPTTATGRRPTRRSPRSSFGCTAVTTRGFIATGATGATSSR